MTGDLAAADVAVLTDGARERLRPQLGAFRVRPFSFRVWWVRDYGSATPARAWAWLTRREPWSPTGGMREWLAVARRVPPR